MNPSPVSDKSPMPELPEVEVLARHLRPLLRGKTIRSVSLRRAKVLSPTSPREFRRALLGAKFTGLSRRGKYLLFQFAGRTTGKQVTLLGHLGMTGRMFLARKRERLPDHAAVVLDLGGENFIYEDTRYFGRLTLDVSAVEKLGPEPLGRNFQPATFARALKRSRQAIKVKLLDQTAGGRCGKHLRQRSALSGAAFTETGGEPVEPRTNQTVMACDSRSSGRGHPRWQHRAVEFWRRQIGRAFLFWPIAGDAGFLRGAAAGLWPGGPALPEMPPSDKTPDASGAEHVLLSAVPARVNARGDAS